MPENLEILVARLETNFANLLNRYETMAEAYAPTNKQVIENGLRIAEIREDLIELRTKIREDLVELRGTLKERDQKVAELARRLEQEMLACASASGELEQRMRKEVEDREEAERKERQRREEKERDDRRIRNRWAIGILAGGFISAFCVYLGSVLPT